MTKTLRASLMLGLAGCSYGLFLAFMKVANNSGYMRADVMVGQYLSAAAILGAIVLVRYRQKVTVRQVLKLGVVGFFGFACSFCMYETVAATSTSFAVTMLFQYVWIGTLFDCIVRRKAPTRFIVFATVLVVAGTPFAAGLFDGENSFTSAGLLWGIGAAVTYAGMLWTSSRFVTELPSVSRTFYFSVAELILAIVVSPQFFEKAFSDVQVWFFAIPIGLLSVVIPCLLIMKASPQVPMGITTIMTGMELPSTIFFGWLILGQVHSFFVLFGVALICAGIVVANWSGIVELRARQALARQRRKRSAEPAEESETREQQ